METTENTTAKSVNIDRIAIRQPNNITTARYKFTAMQKNIFYHVIDALQGNMTKDIQVSDFGDCEINLPISKIAGKSNYQLILDSLDNLMEKKIAYTFNKDKKEYDIKTIFIYDIMHEKNSGYVTIRIPQKALPMLLSIANGFTSYNKKIALILESVYSKRMYELCCQWKDTGAFVMTVEQFRQMLGLEDKFKNNVAGGLRQKVLEPAKRELDTSADYSFNYKFTKEKGSRAYTHITFKVYRTPLAYGPENMTEQDVLYEQYSKIYNFVKHYLPLAKMPETANKLKDDVDSMTLILDRFARFKADVDSGKIMKHGIEAYFVKILTDEYGIPLEWLPYKKKRKYVKKTKKYEGMPTLNFTGQMPNKSYKETPKINNTMAARGGEAENLGGLVSDFVSSLRKK